MKLLLLICLIIAFLFVKSIKGNKVAEQTFDALGISLSTMNSDTRQKHISFIVPQNTLSVTVSTARLTKQDRCAGRIIYGHIRPYGVPYPNPLEAIVESPMVTHEKEMRSFVINKTGELEDSLLLERPLAGTWYATLYSKPDFSGTSCNFAVHLLMKIIYVTDVGFLGMQQSESNITSAMSLTLSGSVGTFINVPSRWFVHRGEVRVTRCRPLNSSTWLTNLTQCPVELVADSQRIPAVTSQPLTPCCQVLLERLNGANTLATVYVRAQAGSPGAEIELGARELSICSSISTSNVTGNVTSLSVSPTTSYPCFADQLMNHDSYSLAFNSKSGYDRLFLGQQLDLYLLPNTMFALPFTLQQASDTGGSMLASLTFLEGNMETNRNITILACLTRNGILSDKELLNTTKSVDPCPYRFPLIQSSISNTSNSDLLLPYPQYGQWLVQFLLLCQSQQGVDRCSASVSTNRVMIRVRIYTAQCHVITDCGQHGSCSISMSHSVVVSMCSCPIGYAGFGCTQMRDLPSSYAPLRDILLLTLSNVAFAMAFAIALYQKLFVPSVVYLYVLIFSSLYHACDTDYAIGYCILSRDNLSFCDFYGAVMAIWVTVLSMTWLPGIIQAVLTILMALLLVIGVNKDKTSFLLYAIPLSIGVLLLIVSWGYIIYRRRRVFPPWRWFILHFCPGIIIAVTGGVTFYVGDTFPLSYPFTHSVWHFTIALSVCFLLPQPRRWQRIFRWSPVLGFHLDANGEMERGGLDKKPEVKAVNVNSSMPENSTESSSTGTGMQDTLPEVETVGTNSARLRDSGPRQRVSVEYGGALEHCATREPSELCPFRTSSEDKSLFSCDDATLKETLKDIWADIRLLSSRLLSVVSRGSSD